MKIETVNKLMADACGIEIETNDEYPDLDKSLYYQDSSGFEYNWTIEDPRCREVIRDKFEIVTFPFEGNVWKSFTLPFDLVAAENFSKTIAEAEIACIMAICEELENNDDTTDK